MTDWPEAMKRAMERRRACILQEASRLLATGGLEALTLRTLAENAGVTVPTIYNLIGGKEQVIGCLTAEALAAVNAALAALPALRGVDRAEAAVRGHFTLCLSDPHRYGALYRSLRETPGRPFSHAEELFCASVREAVQSGDLHGRLQPEPLGRHILHGQIETFRLWGVGALNASATEARALYALHVAFMADATKQGRRKLLERVRVQEARLLLI
jgi:AcrR family transcriptional regulator